LFDLDGYAYNHKSKKKYGWRCLHHKNLILGDKCDIGHGSLLQAAYGIEIGELCEVGPFVYLCTFDTIGGGIKGKITMEPGSRVGAHSIVMPGVTIGKNSIIGANSVVTKDVPPNQVWLGSPAKKQRKLKKKEMRVE